MRARVVLNAALGCALGSSRPAAAAAALALLHGADGAVDTGAQLKVLEIAAVQRAWAVLESEATAALGRGAWVSPQQPHLLVMLDETVRLAEVAAGEAAAARGAAAACSSLRAQLAATNAADGLAPAGPAAPATLLSGLGPLSPQARSQLYGGATAEEARAVARRYSRSIALPAQVRESTALPPLPTLPSVPHPAPSRAHASLCSHLQHDAPLDVVYEDDELLAVCKPVGVPVHPRHRFECRSIVNAAVAHLGGRAPCDGGRFGLVAR